MKIQVTYNLTEEDLRAIAFHYQEEDRRSCIDEITEEIESLWEDRIQFLRGDFNRYDPKEES